jgi:hypothetical protein
MSESPLVHVAHPVVPPGSNATILFVISLPVVLSPILDRLDLD